jgi:hypothetical protein
MFASVCFLPLPTQENAMAEFQGNRETAPSTSVLSLRSRLADAFRMTLLWLGLGFLVGALSAPPERGIVAILAGAIAGMIVLPLIGAVLGFLGGKWRETLVGGVAGLMLGTLAGLFAGGNPSDVRAFANMALVSGALVGATLVPLYTQIRKGLGAFSRTLTN